MIHGKVGTYTHHRCRCAPCTEAASEYKWKLRHANLAKPIPAFVYHGSNSTYNNWDCRCAPCRDAHRVALAAYRAAKRAS